MPTKILTGKKVMTKADLERELSKSIGTTVRLRPDKRLSRQKVKLGKLIRVCSGGRHAVYETNLGPLKKPYMKEKR